MGQGFSVPMMSFKEPILKCGGKQEGHSPHILLEACAWTLEANHTEGPPAGAPASPLAWLSSVLFGCWVESLQKAAVHICG